MIKMFALLKYYFSLYVYILCGVNTFKCVVVFHQKS